MSLSDLAAAASRANARPIRQPVRRTRVRWPVWFTLAGLAPALLGLAGFIIVASSAGDPMADVRGAIAFLLMALGLLITGIGISFCPYQIAANRQHPNAGAILACCICSIFVPALGLILWVVALIWAHTATPSRARGY